MAVVVEQMVMVMVLVFLLLLLLLLLLVVVVVLHSDGDESRDNKEETLIMLLDELVSFHKLLFVYIFSRPRLSQFLIYINLPTNFHTRSLCRIQIWSVQHFHLY